MADPVKTVQRKQVDTPLDGERRRRQRGRNWAVLLALAAFVAIVYAITIVKLRGA